MKKLVAILLTLVFLVGCTAFAEGDDWTSREVTLTIIHEHTEENAKAVTSSCMFRRCMEEFLALYPNVHIEETALGSNDASQKLSVLAAADTLPDVVYLYNGLFSSVVGEEMLADITNVLDADTFRDGLDTFSYDGKVYGVPIKYSTYCYMYYNAEMWEAAGYEEFPATWGELLEAAQNEYFTSNNITPVIFANMADGTWGTYLYLNPIIFEVCGEEWVNSIIANDGNAKFTDECFIEALNKLASLKPMWNVDFNSQSDQPAVAEYAKGKAAAHLSGPWVATSLKGFEAEYPGIVEKTRVAKVPSFDGEHASISYAIPQGLGISASIVGTDKYEAAVAFLKYMGGSSYSQYMAEAGEMGPVKVAAVESAGFAQMQLDSFAVLNSVANYPELVPNLSAPTASAYKSATMSFLAGAITAEECAAEIQATLE